MAKKSLVDLQAQIEKLQAQANQLREQEKAGVVARIREAITAYELSEADLFSAASAKRTPPKRGNAAATRSAAYADGSGNVWGGRGPRPRWLREALQQGRTLDEFATWGRSTNARSASATEQGAQLEASAETAAPRGGAGNTSRKSGRAAGKTLKAKLPAKYRDDAGNSWSGRGTQPRWLQQALGEGKALESFQVAA